MGIGFGGKDGWGRCLRTKLNCQRIETFAFIKLPFPKPHTGLGM